MVTDQALRGLDNLELQPAPGTRDPGRLARKAWAALWPKVLAIVAHPGRLGGRHPHRVEALCTQGPGTGVLQPLERDAARQPVPVEHHRVTLETAIVGYAAALVIGSVIGLLVARISPLRAAVGSIITGLQTMPSIVWVPFAIIIFGESESAILFVVILGAAPSIAAGLISGVDYTPPLLLRAGKTMGLRGPALYRYLILPASLPALRGRNEAGLGVRLAQPDGRRDRRPDRRPVLDRPVHQRGSGEPGLRCRASMLIVILIIGLVVDTIFTKADLALRRRRGLLDPAAA